MSWIILEGLDRTGKSTVAELYKEKGFEVGQATYQNSITAEFLP